MYHHHIILPKDLMRMEDGENNIKSEIFLYIIHLKGIMHLLGLIQSLFKIN